jgi:hypothetical protein
MVLTPSLNLPKVGSGRLQLLVMSTTLSVRILSLATRLELCVACRLASNSPLIGLLGAGPLGQHSYLWEELPHFLDNFVPRIRVGDVPMDLNYHNPKDLQNFGYRYSQASVDLPFLLCSHESISQAEVLPHFVPGVPFQRNGCQSPLDFIGAHPAALHPSRRHSLLDQIQPFGHFLLGYTDTLFRKPDQEFPCPGIEDGYVFLRMKQSRISQGTDGGVGNLGGNGIAAMLRRPTTRSAVRSAYGPVSHWDPIALSPITAAPSETSTLACPTVAHGECGLGRISSRLRESNEGIDRFCTHDELPPNVSHIVRRPIIEVQYVCT